jgi:murein DD-endopeptidase MepM/ murein hydrolase activator NlpD
MEHRLIYRRLDELQKKQSSTILSTNPTRQQAANTMVTQDASQLGLNAPRATAGLSESFTPYKDIGEAEAQARREYQDSGSISAETTAYLQRMGGNADNISMQGPVGPASGAQMYSLNEQQRADQVANAKTPQRNLGLVDTSSLAPITNAGVTETPEQFAARKASIEAQNASKLQGAQAQMGIQGMQKDKEQASIGAANTTSPNPMLDMAQQTILKDPALAPYFQDELNAIQGNADSITSQKDQALGNFNASDRNNNGVTDGVEAAVSESKKYLSDDNSKQNAINDENRDINLEAAKVAKEGAEIAQKKFELQQARDENLLREQNIEAEIKNRRIANRLGITTDSNGLKWMQEEIRKGTEALVFLQNTGSLQEAQFALETGRAYNLNVRSATNAHAGQALVISSQLRNDMAELDNTISLDAKGRREERDKIMEKFWERMDKNDERTAETLKEYRTEAFTRIREQEKAKLDGTMTDGDALKFTQTMESAVAGMQEFKSFKTVNFNYEGMLAAKEVYDADPSTKGAFDTALVKLYEKILDPESVVRQEEFNSQLKSQGIVRGTIQSAIDAFNGGQGLDESAQAAMVKMSQSLFNSARQNTLQAVQPKLAQVSRFNKQSGANVMLEEIFTNDVIDALDIPVDEFEAAAALVGDVDDLNLDEPEQLAAPTDFNSWLSMTGNGKTVSGSPYHKGIDANALDIDGKIGDPITPVAAGYVSGMTQDRKKGYGLSVIVTDDQGNEHLYAHMDEISVKPGQRIEPGMLLGKMGNTGNVIAGPKGDGSHLHYRMSNNGQSLLASHNQ